MFKYLKIAKNLIFITSVSTIWYASFTTNKEDKIRLRQEAFNKGLGLSQKYKKYKSWDKFVEPFIIKQFGFFFGLGHSFVKGMISDNDKKIDNQLDDIICEVTECLEKE